MRAILDTQALLWSAWDDPRLPAEARKFISSANNERILSTATIWEIAIKSSIGKLQLDRPVRRWIDMCVVEMSLSPLQLSWDHAMRTAELPLHHRDPFDRLLIAQATAEHLPIVTGDKDFRRYDIEIIW